MEDKLLKVTEVANLLNLSQYQVLAYCREGIIPSVRLGRQVRFSRSALDKFINEGGKQYPGGWKKEA